MKERYIVIGTRRYGNQVRLSLQKEDIVQDKGQNDIVSMILSNPEGYVKQMKEEAVFTQQPDTITISFEDWELHEYKIGDVVFVDVEPLEKMEFSGE